MARQAPWLAERACQANTQRVPLAVRFPACELVPALRGTSLQALRDGVAAARDASADTVRGAIFLAVAIREGAQRPDFGVDVAEVEIRIKGQGAAAAWPPIIARGVAGRGTAMLAGVDADRTGRATEGAADAVSGGATDAVDTRAAGATGRSRRLGHAGAATAFQALPAATGAVRLREAGAAFAGLAHATIAARAGAEGVGPADASCAGGRRLLALLAFPLGVGGIAARQEHEQATCQPGEHAAAGGFGREGPHEGIEAQRVHEDAFLFG